MLLWDLGGARQAAGNLSGSDADFGRALEADATFLPALRAQARLREATGDGRAAAELYAREARLTKAPTRAAAAFRQAARLYANQVRDDAMAGRCLEEVLAIEPEAETDFEVLQVILRARGEDDRLAQVMRRRAAAGTLPKRRDRLLALAELTYARDPVEAAAVLAEAVKLDPTSVPVLLRLAEVEAELGRSAEAIATYRSAIAVSADSRTVSAAWVRVGDIAERALADADQAVEAYRNALLAAPDELSALAGLVRGLTRRRDFAEAAIVLRRLATVESEPEARVGHLVTLGELLAGPAEDPEGAADAFEQALALDPHHDLAIDRLDAMLVRLGEPSRLAAALGRYLEVAPGARTRRLRLAALWSGPLGSSARAIDELRVVVATADDDVEARTELARVLEAAERFAGGHRRASGAPAARAAAGCVVAGAAPALRARGRAAPGCPGGRRAGGARPHRRRRRARGPRGTSALDARDDRSDLGRRLRVDHPPPRRAPPGDPAAGGDVRGAAAPLWAGAGGLGGQQAGPAAAPFGGSAARAGQPGRRAVRRRGHVRRLPGARDRHPGRDRGGPAAGAAAAAELRRASAARGLPPAGAAARTSARRDLRGRAHPGEGSRPPGGGRRANGLLRLRARHPARRSS